jgi:hypothetical protein
MAEVKKVKLTCYMCKHCEHIYSDGVIHCDFGPNWPSHRAERCEDFEYTALWKAEVEKVKPKPIVPVKIGRGTVVHVRIGKGQTGCGLGSSRLWHDEVILPEGTPITCKKCTPSVWHPATSYRPGFWGKKGADE